MTAVSGNEGLPPINAGSLSKVTVNNVTMSAISAGPPSTGQELAKTVAESINALDSNLAKRISTAGGQEILAKSIQDKLSRGQEAFPNEDALATNMRPTATSVQPSDKGMNI